MLLTEKEIFIPATPRHNELLGHISRVVARECTAGEVPIRLAVTKTTADGYHCELGFLSDTTYMPSQSIFDYRQRAYENHSAFNAVLLIPTGIGAELGGHSGDGGALAKLMGEACDTLITHPNVVNAADINEMTENTLYVEGSVISRLMMGSIALQPVRANRLLVVIDDHGDDFITEASINSVSAARVAMGLDCPTMVKLSQSVRMKTAYSKSGRAAGHIDRLSNLCEVLKKYEGQYDAAAISSVIEVPDEYHTEYFREDMYDMVNPWGGVEAMLTHAVSLLFDIPSAHSPMSCSREVLEMSVGVVDPRKSAEAVSTTYLHCILKGLQRSPRILADPPRFGAQGLIAASDISCLVIPDGCVGLPTLAALEQGIPVIAVRENRNCMQNSLEDLPFESGKLFVVENYLEAVGVMAALKSGVAVETVRRPMNDTIINHEIVEQCAVKCDDASAGDGDVNCVYQNETCKLEVMQND